MTETKQDYKTMTHEQLALLSFPLPDKIAKLAKLINERQFLIVDAFSGGIYAIKRITEIDTILEEIEKSEVFQEV